MKHGIFVGWLLLGAVMACSALADQFTYANERFGTSVTFPSDIFTDRMEPPANGGGMTFLSTDGASLAVFGMNNALEQTPGGLIEEAKTRGDAGFELTYSAAGDDWAVLSGYEEGLVFYRRFEFGADDVIHAVHIKYPAELKPVYDPLVGPIAGSLQGP